MPTPLVLLLSFFIIAAPIQVLATTCYDFSKKPFAINNIKVDLKDKISNQGRVLKDASHPQSFHFAEVRGQIKKPILEIVELLKDPKTIHTPETETKISVMNFSDFFYAFEKSVKIKPTFFLTLEWSEQWAFKLDQGTLAAPKLIQIFYQKTTGTQHIEHLCGQYRLTSIHSNETQVEIREELEATHRSAQDIENGLKGTLKTLSERSSIPEKK